MKEEKKNKFYLYTGKFLTKSNNKNWLEDYLNNQYGNNYILKKENLEENLHYTDYCKSLNKEMVKATKHPNVSFFYTTQSKELIYAFIKASEDFKNRFNFKIIRIDGSKTNNIAVKFYQDEFDMILEDELEVRGLYFDERRTNK